MTIQKNTVIEGADGLPIAVDIFYVANQQPKPVVIYAHGFNGFKDWGNADLWATQIAAAGLVLVKFNFSHNGTNVSQPEDFVNLEAFGTNNYSKQLYDLEQVVNWICSEQQPHQQEINTQQIALMGHSMGGGICILYAAKDQRMKQLITWASIAVCKTPWTNWPPEKIAEWENTGIAYYHNSRTNQQMPLYYQLYQDFEEHQQQLDISKAISQLNIPVLICHGTADTAVPFSAALQLQSLQPRAMLFSVDSDHVFGRKHPWPESHLPNAMQAVLDASIQFLQNKA